MRGPASEPGSNVAQQSTACRLPGLRGRGALPAAPAAQAGLAAAEMQQAMQTQPGAQVQERGAQLQKIPSTNAELAGPGIIHCLVSIPPQQI